MRQMQAAAVEDVLSKMFKRTPDGWTLDSPYPRIFNWRRWTYLLTDAQKERLAERMRRGMRTTYLVTIGLCIVLATSLAFWFRHPGPGMTATRASTYVQCTGSQCSTCHPKA